MADPRPLFYVTAVVVFGLIVWVASVLLRPGPKWKAVTAAPSPSSPPPADAAVAEASDAPEVATKSEAKDEA